MYSGRCPHCRVSKEFRLHSKEETVSVRGVDVAVPAQFLVCTNCSGEFNDPLSEFDQMELAYREFRSKKGMLQPEQLKSYRRDLGLTQRELCQLLGWGKVTLSRYESGWLQDESHDRALQLAMQPAGLLKLLEIAAKTKTLSEERIETLRHRVIRPPVNSAYVRSLPPGVEHIHLTVPKGDYRSATEDFEDPSEAAEYGT